MKLNEYYAEKRNGLTANFKKMFVSWPTGPHNSLWWTSIHVCPLTGECFASGTLYGLQCEKGMWYRTKKLAERAAAGRAMDCFLYREDREAMRFCREQPYHEHSSLRRRLDIPPHVPNPDVAKIKTLQDVATNGALD